MATSRAFTYATTSPPTDITKTGSIWVGPTTDQEIPFDGGYGGKIWWMGPDEDNRYVIGKDVPTSDWPAKGDTPPYPHDSGSVRFWDSANNEGAFVTRVNTLPARQGETPFDDGVQAESWISSSGYWTNFGITPPDPGSYFALFELYTTPGGSAYEEPYLSYNSSNDKMFGWNVNMGNARGNGIFDDISTISQGDLYIVSESAQYQPTTASIGVGMMCFNGSDGYLSNGEDVVKYNTNTNTVISTVSTIHGDAFDKNNRPVFEPSTDKVFIPLGQYVDIFDTSPLSFSGSINMAVLNNNAAGIALVNTDDNEVLIVSKEGFSIFNPTTKALISSDTLSGMLNISNGRYNSATGKYYIGGKGTNNRPRILVIDATLYTTTTVNIVESGGTNNNMATSIALDTVRNFIWCMNDDRKIASLDCTDNSVTHYDTTFSGTNFAVMPYVIDDKLFIGTQVNNNSGKVYKLSTVINDG